jgi:hypothetical protein
MICIIATYTAGIVVDAQASDEAAQRREEDLRVRLEEAQGRLAVAVAAAALANDQAVSVARPMGKFKLQTAMGVDRVMYRAIQVRADDDMISCGITKCLFSAQYP